MDGLLQHLHAPPTALALGKVKDTADPHVRGRVKVTLLSNDMDVWAACVVPSAGRDYGVALLPKADEIVLVAFLSPDQPFVLGSVWSGRNGMPADEAPVADRYAVKTKSGTTIVLDDSDSSLTITTPHNNSIKMTGSQSCTVTVGATTIEATPTAVTVTTSAAISLKTQILTVTASMVTVSASLAQFTGIVQCETLITNSVVSASYTPGAGNLW